MGEIQLKLSGKKNLFKRALILDRPRCMFVKASLHPWGMTSFSHFTALQMQHSWAVALVEEEKP